jgi:hypothetical protein
MTKPNIQIHDLESGEIIEREMTDVEFALQQAILERDQKQFEELQAKAQAKTVLLERLGLTQEEFNTLTA